MTIIGGIRKTLNRVGKTLIFYKYEKFKFEANGKC